MSDDLRLWPSIKPAANAPLGVIGLDSGATSIVAGDYSDCALTAAESAKCWGRNTFGQLGDGSTIDRDVPVDLTGL